MNIGYGLSKNKWLGRELKRELKQATQPAPSACRHFQAQAQAFEVILSGAREKEKSYLPSEVVFVCVCHVQMAPTIIRRKKLL